MSGINVVGSSLRYKNLLVVIKQTAFEEYSQLKIRGQAPKALRWKRLESRYKAHKQCVNDLLGVLRQQEISFSCVNRVELDRQHLADIDLMVAVGGDGTVLSAAHFLDHGTIPLLGVNSDPNVSIEDIKTKKQVDERRSHGALCMSTALDLQESLPKVLYGESEDDLTLRTRIRCKVKSTFSETRLVPALNDLLIANPSPASVSRFRMGWMEELDPNVRPKKQMYGTITRFAGIPYDITRSLNVWSSGMWMCTSTGASAAMAAAGGKPMVCDSTYLQYMIREHMMENSNEDHDTDVNNRFVKDGEKIHLRWNSQRGRIFIDGSHLTHNLELGDEILIDNDGKSSR
jgi:NAD+ kinase